MVSFIILLAGFVLLVWGADHFVAGASALAKKVGIPPLIIGLTVVAFGTSAPELTVSATAGIKGANELAISNVLGSNMFNLLVVIGGCAIFTPQTSDKSLLRRDWPFCLMATAALALMIVFDRELSRIDAGILLLGFFTVIGIQIHAGIKARQLDAENDDISDMTNPLHIAFNVFAGMACIGFGGDFCVTGATEIASMFGFSDTLIGLTVVSVGTSLPELVTSIAATRRGEKEIAIGNVVGSNLFNLLLILGVSGLLTPIPVMTTAIFDIGFLLCCSVAVYFMSRKEQIGKVDGFALVACYVIYMTWVVIRDIPVVEAVTM